ncbi:hypothetical protein THAOC_10740, partial [Thalassiosira oceanica]
RRRGPARARWAPWGGPRRSLQTGRRVDRLQQGLAARAVSGAVLVVDDEVAVAGRGEELGDHRAVGHADGAVGLGPRQEAPAQGQRRRDREHSEGNLMRAEHRAAKARTRV